MVSAAQNGITKYVRSVRSKKPAVVTRLRVDTAGIIDLPGKVYHVNFAQGIIKISGIDIRSGNGIIARKHKAMTRIQGKFDPIIRTAAPKFRSIVFDLYKITPVAAVRHHLETIIRVVLKIHLAKIQPVS